MRVCAEDWFSGECVRTGRMKKGIGLYEEQ